MPKCKNKTVNKGINGYPWNITLIGDATVPKDRMAIAYTIKEYPVGPLPGVIDTPQGIVHVDGIEYFISIMWAIQGAEDDEKFRILSYPHTDCFLICFALDDRKSFENITDKWLPEVRHHCPNTKILLVGAKGELRSHDSSLELIPASDGYTLQKNIKAFKYMEFSTTDVAGLEEIFQEAVRALVTDESSSRESLCKCCLL